MLHSPLLSFCLACLIAIAVKNQARALELCLPTENRSLMEGRPEGFFQFVDRDFEGAKSTPWEGGQFGFVRDPRRVGSRIAYARFHEGLDVKPMARDAKGDPTDEVRAIAAGEVAYITASSRQSNYGRYIVVRHDWGEGPFYSLYAHLKEARVAVGDKVSCGQPIALMGYTGSGIDQRRAHVHVELNLFLNSEFEAWHAASFTTPNHHGLYNGINLLGLNLQDLYAAWQKDPKLSVAHFVMQSDSWFEVAVPGSATMELARRYRWLVPEGAASRKPVSWTVRFTRWGLPVSIQPATTFVGSPTVTWIKPDPVPHYYNTRGLVTGSGTTGKLTVEGLRFIQLACGLAP